MAYQNTAQQLSKVGILKQSGDRVVLHETFQRAPKVNTSVSGGLAPEVNLDFEVQNAGTAVATALNVEGGVLMSTDSSGGAHQICMPHLDTGQSLWSTMTWGTDKEVAFNAHIVTGASIDDTIIIAGFKLTKVVTTATDADQVFFRLDDGTNSGRWQAISSGAAMITSCTASGDDTGDTGVAGAASTEYILTIIVDADRVARFFINHEFKYEAPCAMDDATDLIPYVGVQADAAASKTMRIISLACSRDV